MVSCQAGPKLGKSYFVAHALPLSRKYLTFLAELTAALLLKRSMSLIWWPSCPRTRTSSRKLPSTLSWLARNPINALSPSRMPCCTGPCCSPHLDDPGLASKRVSISYPCGRSTSERSGLVPSVATCGTRRCSSLRRVLTMSRSRSGTPRLRGPTSSTTSSPGSRPTARKTAPWRSTSPPRMGTQSSVRDGGSGRDCSKSSDPGGCNHCILQ